MLNLLSVNRVIAQSFNQSIFKVSSMQNPQRVSLREEKETEIQALIKRIKTLEKQ